MSRVNVTSFARATTVSLVISDNTFDAAVGEGMEDIEVAFAVVALAVRKDAGSSALDPFVGEKNHAMELSSINRNMCVLSSHDLGCMLSKIILNIFASSSYLSLLKLCSKLRNIRNNMWPRGACVRIACLA